MKKVGIRTVTLDRVMVGIVSLGMATYTGGASNSKPVVPDWGDEWFTLDVSQLDSGFKLKE